MHRNMRRVDSDQS